MIIRAPKAPPVPPHLEPYVTFLEIDREDLLSGDRNSGSITPLTWRIESLGCEELLRRVEPIMSLGFTVVPMRIAHLQDSEMRLKSYRVADSKAKSRKKLRGKV